MRKDDVRDLRVVTNLRTSHAKVVEQLGLASIGPDDSWLGRIIDPLGQPLMHCPQRVHASKSMPCRAAPKVSATPRSLAAARSQSSCSPCTGLRVAPSQDSARA